MRFDPLSERDKSVYKEHPFEENHPGQTPSSRKHWVGISKKVIKDGLTDQKNSKEVQHKDSLERLQKWGVVNIMGPVTL